MRLTIIIGIILLYYVLHQFDKRVKRLEESRGQGYSHWLSVNVDNAVVKHKKFGELIGIKSASEGKDYNHWSKEEKEKWGKMKDEGEQLSKSNVYLAYLSAENAYFMSNYKDNPHIIFRDRNSNLLYSAIVVGDKDGFNPHIEFLLYERLIKKANGKYEWVLVPCLQYRKSHLSFNEEDKSFEILCEFPHFQEQMADEELKKQGFEIERSGGDDFYKDSFGQMRGVPMEVKYKKNGAEIRYVH